MSPTALSEEELVDRAASSRERISTLVELGVIVPGGGSEPFRPSDVQRVRLADAFEQAGISIEAVGRGVASGRLSFAPLDVLFPEPPSHGGVTYREFADERGLTVARLRRIIGAFGLAEHLDDEGIREDDANAIRSLLEATDFRDVGLEADVGLRLARIYGENVRRIAESAVRLWREMIEEPLLLVDGVPQPEMEERVVAVGARLMDVLDGLTLWLHRRHLEHHVLENLIGNVETTLEAAGLAERRTGREPAIAFLDLTGFTHLTDEQGDEVAASLAETLVDLVQSEARNHAGRAVKFLGDGVMFHFPEPGDAVTAALELVQRVPAAGLPPARVGVNAGTVIFRDGDYFGRTVNVAARIADYARPGEVLVGEAVLRYISTPPAQVEAIGPVALKGVADPVSLHRVLGSTP